MLTPVHNDADNTNDADDYNRMIGIALLKAFGCANNRVIGIALLKVFSCAKHEVLLDFFDHVTSLPLSLAPCDANGNINETTAFLRLRQQGCNET